MKEILNYVVDREIFYQDLGLDLYISIPLLIEEVTKVLGGDSEDFEDSNYEWSLRIGIVIEEDYSEYSRYIDLLQDNEFFKHASEHKLYRTPWAEAAINVIGEIFGDKSAYSSLIKLIEDDWEEWLENEVHEDEYKEYYNDNSDDHEDESDDEESE